MRLASVLIAIALSVVALVVATGVAGTFVRFVGAMTGTEQLLVTVLLLLAAVAFLLAGARRRQVERAPD